MLADRVLLRLQMQLYAACSDTEIRVLVQDRCRRLRQEVAALSGAGGPELHAFFAHGMLLNVAATIDLPELGDAEDW